MDLEELAVPSEEAARKLAEYESVPADQRTAEDAALRTGYRAASRGRAVISLPLTIGAAGYHGNGLPRLAVARGDATECWCWWDGSAAIYTSDEWAGNQGALVGRHSVRVPLMGDELPARRPNSSWSRGHTLVPLVPPACRSSWPRMRSCHILWEVEEWELVAPRDPALIHHLRGDLWEVFSTWNLTELERSVLSQRVAVRR